jgi:PAS domain S-box-containing protein
VLAQEWSVPLVLLAAIGLAIAWLSGYLVAKRKTENAYARLRTTEGSLRMTESRLRRIFDSNMIGLIFTDFQGHILDANDYLLNMIGASRDELLAGKLSWRDFTPPEHLEASDTALQSLREHDYFPPFEKEYVHRDGHRFSVLLGATKVEDNLIVAFILDISDRKNAEKAITEANNRLELSVALRTKELTDANIELTRLVKEREQGVEKLRESESFLDLVIENIPNMIFVKDAKSLKFVRFNKAGEQLVGRRRDELLG